MKQETRSTVEAKIALVGWPSEKGVALSQALANYPEVECRAISPGERFSASVDDELICVFDGGFDLKTIRESANALIVIGSSIPIERTRQLIEDGGRGVYDIERFSLIDELPPLLVAHAKGIAYQNDRASLNPNAQSSQSRPTLGIVEWDRDLIICRWSDEAETLSGISRNEAVGRTLGSWILDRDEMSQFLSGCKSLSSGWLGNFKSNCRIKHADGSLINAHWKISPSKSHSGNSIALFEPYQIENRAPRAGSALLTDSNAEVDSPSKKNSRTNNSSAVSKDVFYKERAEFLANAVEQLSIGVYVKETVQDKVFTVWNAQMAQLFRIQKERIIGKRLEDAFSDPLLRTILGDADSTHARSRAIVPRSKLDGKPYSNFIADIIRTPIKDSDGQTVAIVGIVHDVTDRIQSENRLVSAFNELEVSKEKLEQSNLEIRKGIEKAKKLAVAAQASNRAKSVFLSNISHELRTPLNSIVSLTNALLEGTFGPMNLKQSEYLEIVADSGKHLEALITDILDLSKIELGKLNLKFAKVFPEDTARASIKIVQQQAQAKNVDCQMKIDPAIRAIDVDPKRLKQILLNLLFNAIKFAEPNTSVQLNISKRDSDEIIDFQIIDQGIGIKNSDIDRIFMPFTQLDDSLSKQYEGTGLGLAIVSKLIELHGGGFSAASEVNKGSVFTVSLPVEQDSFVSDQEKRGLVELIGGQLSGSLVLIIDENERLADRARRDVLAHGFDLAIITMPTELSAYYDHLSPTTVIADLATLNNHGSDWIDQASGHDLWRNTRWIAISSLDIPANRTRAASLGFDTFIPKPLTKSAFQQLYPLSKLT